MKWWQRLARWIINAAKNILDVNQPVEKIQAFLCTSLDRASVESLRSDIEAAYAMHLTVDLGLMPDRSLAESPAPNLPTRMQFEEWRQKLVKGQVLDRTGLASGAGLMLLSILDEPGRHQDFLQTELERLLRRVEIKRQAALEPAEDDDRQTLWLERHAVAILFSRVARVTQDLRFLNAALKLNDWAFPSHRRLGHGRRWARYLWSLAEQEVSCMELLE